MVWKLLKSELGPDSVIVEKGDEVVLTPKDAKVESLIGALEPLFVWNASRKQLFFSLTEEDLATWRGAGARITNDADCKMTTREFSKRFLVSFMLRKIF